MTLRNPFKKMEMVSNPVRFPVHDLVRALVPSSMSAIFLAAGFNVCLSNLPAHADDGGISFGGAPHLMGGHASVAMQDEVITMDVKEKAIDVDCKFLFHNSGPKCTVRMGFPDEGTGAAEPYQGEDKVPTGSALHATFTSYDSWVDGKKVPTKIISTSDRALYWHTKSVTFKAKSDCEVRDKYSLPPGAQVTSENGLYQQTYYVLHTGASWHGPIGKAEIVVKFAPNTVPAPIELKAVSSLPGQSIDHLKWSSLPPGTVIYSGPSTPTLEGNTLRFVRTSFKPTINDDVHLYYGYHKLQNGQ